MKKYLFALTCLFMFAVSTRAVAQSKHRRLAGQADLAAEVERYRTFILPYLAQAEFHNCKLDDREATSETVKAKLLDGISKAISLERLTRIGLSPEQKAALASNPVSAETMLVIFVLPTPAAPWNHHRRDLVVAKLSENHSAITSIAFTSQSRGPNIPNFNQLTTTEAPWVLDKTLPKTLCQVKMRGQ